MLVPDLVLAHYMEGTLVQVPLSVSEVFCNVVSYTMHRCVAVLLMFCFTIKLKIPADVAGIMTQASGYSERSIPSSTYFALIDVSNIVS